MNKLNINDSISIEEAKQYLIDSVKYWEESDQADKVKSLAKFAFRWNSDNGGPAKVRKAIETNINQLENMINRNKKSKFPCEPFEIELKIYQEKLVQFDIEHPKKEEAA
jgi:hypothetical protein